MSILSDALECAIGKTLAEQKLAAWTQEVQAYPEHLRDAHLRLRGYSYLIADSGEDLTEARIGEVVAKIGSSGNLSLWKMELNRAYTELGINPKTGRVFRQPLESQLIPHNFVTE
jgi:hypothetical protein